MGSSPQWSFGDGASGEGVAVSHAYEKPGIYHVELRAKDGGSERTSSAILRVHTPQTVHLPQILLDTDARNEVDDQHYISYALFSELDVLGINSVHHGGGPESANRETFNGGNDLWSVYVLSESGIEFWIILENPTGASICMDKRTEAHLYPDNALGNYLKMITPAHCKALYDISTVSMVISEHLNLDWLKEIEPVKVLGPNQDYRWKRVREPANVHVIRDVDEDAMKKDFFSTLNSRPMHLIPREE